jgi:mono/diheme cytochrome c family protein
MVQYWPLVLRRPGRFVAWPILLLTLWPVTAAGDDLFRDRVAAILQNRCVACHNDTDKQGGYSLQSRDSAMAEGHLVPGDAAASHLVDLITPDDGTADMPQDGPPLNADDILVIREWIDSGAGWPVDFRVEPPKLADFDWWSFQPLQRPALPDCASDPWVRTPVDAFVLDRQRIAGLSPSPQADRRTLIRRLTYDLHGLPPGPAEVEAFVKDPDPQAYEKLVDRLLASHRYGERWARHWLDVVQYADTCGYDKDKLRPQAWPYRDYVIRSLNEDKSWGRFVQEQIAGDVLFPGQADGIVALGFIAAGPWDFIGHVEVPESKLDGKVARNLDRDNMVTNAFNAFCSMTVQCARCHDHKFDPVSQEQYYGLQAVFAAVDRAERLYDPDSRVAARRVELQRELEQTLARQDRWQKQLLAAGGDQLEGLNERIARLEEGPGRANVKQSEHYGYHSSLETESEVEKWIQLEFASPVTLSRIVVRPCYDNFAGIGAGFGFPKQFRVELSSDGRQWQVILNRTEEDVANPGLRPLTIELPGQQPASPPVQFLRFTATRLAERSGDYMLALAEIEALDEAGRNVAHTADVTVRDSIEAPPRWARQHLVDGHWPEWLADLPEQPQAEDRDDQLRQLRIQRDRLLQRLRTPRRARQKQEIEARLREIRQDLSNLPPAARVYAAATTFEPQGSFRPTNGKPREVRVLRRGDIRQPGKPAVPGVLPLHAGDQWQMDANLPESQRRAQLARWLSDPVHPLVWRSIVNRVWQYHFGTGIVATPNDFGRMGELPTHPRLLDWLTRDFLDHGQSLKYLHRLIVTSSVYRQASTTHPAKRSVDADNRYLWRMNRRRLTAEEIRDSMLAVSGALRDEPGGPGFYLFELEKTEHSPHYEYHKFDPTDPATHRRSIYRFVVRSQPDPWMTSLDCADSSQSTPRRSETLTALQALSLLNNRFSLVMAEQFAASLEQESGDVRQQVEQALRCLLQRPATTQEAQRLAELARQYGMPAVCRVLFNLSEFVYVD